MNTLNNVSYEQDFYAWALKNAELIRQGRFLEIDAEHIAEELESIGKSERRELINRLAVLLAHLLKWAYQPNRRGNSWRYTIKGQRLSVLELLEDSPSLKHELEQKLQDAYRKALILAARQTRLDEKSFPETCPFTLAQAIDDNFWPDDPI